MKKSVMIAVLILDLFLLLLFVPSVRSIAVMSVYSLSESKTSVFRESGIDLKMPGGISTKEKDWFPFMMVFNADGFSAESGETADLSILYNFGAFDSKKNCSSLYDENSAYHGAFYGAYAVRPQSNLPFAYDENGNLVPDILTEVFKYDMQTLVLKSLGCSNPEFTFEILSTSKEEMFGHTFDVVDAKIQTNSPLHRQRQFYQAYLQYGSPYLFDSKKDFKKMTTYGRIYAVHIDSCNTTLCLYVIAPHPDTIETTANNFIKKSKLSFN